MKIFIFSAFISISVILFVLNLHRIARTEKFSIQEKEIIFETLYESSGGIILLFGLLIFFYFVIGLWVLPMVAFIGCLFYCLLKKRIIEITQIKKTKN